MLWDLQDYSAPGSSKTFSNVNISSYTRLAFLNSSMYEISLKFVTAVDFLVVCDGEHIHYDYNHSKYKPLSALGKKAICVFSSVVCMLCYV